MEREGRPDRTPASSRAAVAALLGVIAAAAAPARAETLGRAGVVVETLSGSGGSYLVNRSMSCADKVETWKPDQGV